MLEFGIHEGNVELLVHILNLNFFSFIIMKVMYSSYFIINVSLKEYKHIKRNNIVTIEILLR